MSKQVSILEKTIAFQEKVTEKQQHDLHQSTQFCLLFWTQMLIHKILHFQTHQQSVQHCINKIEDLNRQAAKTAEKNVLIDQELPDMQVTVAERRHIYDAKGN